MIPSRLVAGPAAPVSSVPISDLQAYGKVIKAIAGYQKTAAPVLLTRAEVDAWLRVRALIQGKDVKNAARLLEDVYPSVDRPGSLTALDAKRLDGQTVTDPAGPNPPAPASKPPEKPWYAHLHLRRSFTDVLLSEDPTQQSAIRKFDDLKGALLSYTRDYRAEHDTWAAEASLIGSFIVAPPLPDNVNEWAVKTYGLIPSVSLHRETTSGKTAPGVSPANEVDQLAYRLGVFVKGLTPLGPLETLTVRGYGTYVTDTGHRSSVPAGQFEIEPQAFLNWRDDSAQRAPSSGPIFLAPLDNLAIGYKRELLSRDPKSFSPGSADYFDPTLLAYQLRLRLRAEYGDIADTGKMVGVDTGSFLRVGPIAELTLDPFFIKQVTLTLNYSYLPSIFGPDQHNALFSANAAWRILDDKENQRILALTAIYTRGGIDVTQQRVNTLKLGLSATF